jgi:hypothetical protein
LATQSSDEVDIFGDRLDGSKAPAIYAGQAGGVPVGIQHTTGELAVRIARERSLAKGGKDESFAVVKPDISMRAARALAVASRRDDHVLLADLDPDLDTVLFGTTTEEFEKNVKRMKVIVSTYKKWEKWDNFYLYATRALQVGTFAFAFLWWESACEKHLLCTTAEDYAARHEQILRSMKDSREHSIEYLIDDLRRNPPKIFPPKLLPGATPGGDDDIIKRHPMDTRPVEVWEAERQQKLLERQAVQAAAGSDTDFLKRARRILLPLTDDWTAVVREEIAEYKESQLAQMRFPRAGNPAS